jgi:hypothetical protein
MENVNDKESHDKPPTTNVETPSPSLQTELDPSKNKPQAMNRSKVWLHFTKVTPIDKEKPKAACNYCNMMLGCHWRHDTSTLKNHLTYNCPTSPLRDLEKSNVPKGQTLLQQSFKKMSESGSCHTTTTQLGFVKYDPIKIWKLVVQYFIIEELPFRHVESYGFRELINGIEPRFNLPCRITLQKDCMKLYEEEKLKLKASLRGKRICITIDTWTSLQNLNYMVVTASYIDSSWRMHKKIIKFNLISSHKGENIGRMLENTLIEWEIESVFTVTADNVTVNDVAIDYMKRKLKDKKCSILGGEFIHMRCAAHILNLIVNEGLKGLGDCVSNIRNAVKFVRSSPQRMARFKECIKCEKIQSTKTVCLDVQTRWNSTYLMLSAAEKYEKAFTRLGEEDGNPFVVPSYDEWKNAREFVKFLKPFYEATLKFSSSTHVTSNSYFIQLCIIIKTLADGCMSCNPIISVVSWDMKKKYEKYWGTMERINLLLYIAHVLDPRTKLKALKYYLEKCSGSDWAKQIETNVKDLLNRLWEQYDKLYGRHLSNLDAGVESSSVASIDVSVDDDDDDALTETK